VRKTPLPPWTLRKDLWLLSWPYVLEERSIRENELLQYTLPDGSYPIKSLHSMPGSQIRCWFVCS